MSFDWFSTATQKELDRFKAICNQLLSRTYVVRRYIAQGRGGSITRTMHSSPLILRLCGITWPFWTGICERTI